MGIKTIIGPRGVESRKVEGEDRIVLVKPTKVLGAFDVDGPICYDRRRVTVATETADFTFDQYGIVLVDCSAGIVTGTFETIDQDSVYQVKKIDSTGNPLVLSGSSIDGQSTQIITEQYTSVTLVASGSSWYIL